MIIDTGIFFHPEHLRELARSKTRLVVPTVALAERLRQLAKANRDGIVFLRTLRRIGVEFEDFSVEQAHRLADLKIPDGIWARRARDAMILAHVGPGDVLWTTNPRDFQELGLDADRLRPVPASS